jgi:hypothetical protein
MHQTGTYHVLLADMDVTGGNIRFLMRSKAPHSVVDAMRNGQSLDLATWNDMISSGYPGLEVIPRRLASAWTECRSSGRSIAY